MSSNQENLLRAVRHYQSSLDKYTENRNDGKLLHYLGKLYHLPVKVVHLEDTGVGRTVNNLRKLGGQVGYSAKELVSKWKEMVVGEQEREDAEEDDDDEDDDDEDGYQSGNEPSTDSDKEEKIRSESSSSHRKSDKRADDKVKKRRSSSSKSDGNDSSSSKRNGHTKYKTHKRKTDSESEEQESPKKRPKTEQKHRTPKKLPDSGSEEEEVEEEEKKKKQKPTLEPTHKSTTKSKHKDSSAKEKHKANKKRDIEKKTKDKDRKSKDEKKEKKPKSVLPNNGIDSGSGASFAEALDMCMPSSSKSTKKRDRMTSAEKKDKTKSEESVPKLLKETNIEPPPIDLNLSSLLPTITPNYRPLGNLLGSDQLQKKHLSDYEALSNIMTSKNQRTKVYSGNKSGTGKVASLFELCSRVLQDNIDALEYTGGVPYSVLKPILEKSTPNQLYVMEHHNPYLIEDTDELWKIHCQKEFRNKKREELETWREMYLRCLDERDAKLKALTANIKQSQDKSIPVRMTKLAYVDAVAKPPRNIARKQAKNGTAFDKKPAMTPAARLSSLATAGEAGKVAVPNPGSRAVERSSSHNVKPKKAPLMLKSISSFKNRFKR